jgi:hypothetical protein
LPLVTATDETRAVDSRSVEAGTIEARPPVHREIDREPGPRRPVVFAVAFVALLALLVVRDRMLFSVATDESGDLAANSIITYQAKHFHLLVGNYSRLGFWHPGPAFFYVQAFGEWLCHDVAGVVPSAWNGQVLAVLALNAALVAAALSVLAGWARSWAAVGLAGAAMLWFLAAHGHLLTGAWTPYMYFAPFLLLLTAGASVAGGRTGDLWALALAGGFLVHGHAQFLLFVPVLAGAALLALAVGLRRRLFRGRTRDWLVALGILAVFALPIVVNLALHWPGEFGRYLTYSSSRQAGGHPLADAFRYVLRFWPGGGPGLAAGVGLLAAAALVRRHQPDRALIAAGTGLGALTTLLLVWYAWHGIDDLSEDYLGYFSYAVPVLVVALAATSIGAGIAASVPASRPALVAAVPTAVLTAVVVAVLAAVVAALLTPTLVTPREPLANATAAIDALRARTGGRAAVLDVEHDTWPQLTGLVIAGERRGQRICTRDRSWAFMLTDEFVCHRADLATGEPFRLSMTVGAADGTAEGTAPSTIIVTLGPAVLSTP